MFTREEDFDWLVRELSSVVLLRVTEEQVFLPLQPGATVGVKCVICMRMSQLTCGIPTL
jgi:hypothetical protein